MSAQSAVDITIVGGGLVGTPLAILLARQGWSVTLLEQQVPTAVVAGSKGYTALSDATVSQLAAEQLWEHAAVDACAIEKVHVSHKGYFGSTQISAQQHDVDALGYVVDNAVFLESFQSALVSSGVQHLQGATVTRVVYSDDDAQVHFTLGQNTQSGEDKTFATKLLIAVDGVSSSIRDAAGITTQHTDYDQVGVLGLVHLSQSHNNIAYERFTPSGPLALLPRPNNTASFVYCINPEDQDTSRELDDAAFLSVLQSEFGYRLGRFDSIEKRIYVPLVRIEAAQQISKRLVLLGNAMRLLHPVAGQGYNLAMRDVAQLVELLSDNSADPGDAKTLQHFSEVRSSDHKRVVRMTDLLARTFRGAASMPAHVRALGLMGLDRIGPLRKRFTEHSMGHVK